MQPPIRVAVVAEGQPLFLRGAAGALDEDPQLEVVVRGSDAHAALAEVLRLEPEVTVLDPAIPGADPRWFPGELARANCLTRIVLLIPVEDSEAASGALASRVKGLVSKRADAAEIRSAVVAVANGGTVVSDSLRDEVGAKLNGAPASQVLTDRERQILQCLSRDLSPREIGAELNLSEFTVKAHLRHIFEKLGVSRQAAAVGDGFRLGLID